MKGRLHEIALAALFMGSLGESGNLTNGLRPEDIDVSPKDKPIPKGCKQYDFDGFSTIAINEKSAKKKYRKFLNTKHP